jgi:hypothetical protein
VSYRINPKENYQSIPKVVPASEKHAHSEKSGLTIMIVAFFKKRVFVIKITCCLLLFSKTALFTPLCGKNDIFVTESKKEIKNTI